MKNELVILTISYPDPLLDKELPYLAASFDKIYLLPQRLAENTVVPKGVEIFSIFKPVQLEKPFPLLRKHFLKILRIYSWMLFYSVYRKHYLNYIKSFLGHLLIELEKIEPLREFIVSKNLQSALYYDYWLVDSTIALAELKRTKVIKYTIARAHGFDLYHERQFEKHVPFQEYRIAFLDRVYTISKHGYNYLRKVLPDSLNKKIILSYLGVSPRLFNAVQKTEMGFFTIVSCSSVIELKRVGLLVEVLMESKAPIHWIHFGDGPLFNDVLVKASELPSNIKVDFKGNRPNEEVVSFYENNYVDLFVSLSQYEGLPVSMMEAIQFGIPILAYSIYGVPEIVTPQTGVLLQLTSTKKQILNTLENSLTNTSFDREGIRQFFARHFNAEKNTKMFIDELSGIYPMLTKSSISLDRYYQQCRQCILDSNDDVSITFNSDGVCSYCSQYKLDEKNYLLDATTAKSELTNWIAKIKREGKGKQYDCILGISGGVDSTYLALKAKEFGLRPLFVHFDNGWNSELAVKNIENVVIRLGFDLHTVVIDWEEFRDLQLAFLKASVVDIELITDHAILASLYNLAIQYRIKFILSGVNYVTESILPASWIHDKRDHVHIRAINKLFGTRELKKFPLLNSLLLFRAEWLGVKSVALLNYLPYVKADVKKIIIDQLQWRDYGGKHYESIFTRFYQSYILVNKFGIDKRKAHLSNLICSGQLTRAEAIIEINTPAYPLELQKQDLEFVLKKLGLTEMAFEAIMKAPVKRHADYPVNLGIYERYPFLKIFSPIWKALKNLRSAT